jgi:hypothetical protein
MINPFDYLFYKLTRFMYHTDVYSPEAYSPYPMALIFAFNIWTIINIIICDYSVYLVIFFILLPPFFMIMIRYWPSIRWQKIETKYKNESDAQKIRGNWLVFLYVAATVGLFIWSFRFIPVKN